MATKQNVLEGIVAGEYGKPFDLTLKHPTTREIQDISEYASGFTITVYAQDPPGTTVINVTGTLPGGGTDGVVRAEWTSDNHPTIPGDWKGQVKFDDSDDDVAKTYPFTMPVKESITD